MTDGSTVRNLKRLFYPNWRSSFSISAMDERAIEDERTTDKELVFDKKQASKDELEK